MKVVAIVPSRFGSTRFNGKPLASIAGIPMIQRVMDCVQQTQCITDSVVATDDSRIVETVNAFGGQVLMTSGQCRTGSDRVAAAAEKMGLTPDDIVVNIQGDQPIIHPSTIEETVKPLLTALEAGDDIGIITPAVVITDRREIINPKHVKVVFDATGRALYFSRSPIPLARDAASPDTADIDIYKHLGIYVYTRRVLDRFTHLPTGRLEDIEKLEQLRALEHGLPIQVVVSRYDSPSVDIPEDIARIEAMLEKTPTS